MAVVLRSSPVLADLRLIQKIVARGVDHIKSRIALVASIGGGYGKKGCAGPAKLGADEAGVEGSGDGGVGGALDEGATVGKEGDGVGATAETEE